MSRKRKSQLVHRADEGTTAAKDRTIAEIARIMSTGAWRPYTSTMEYAAKIGLTEWTVAEYAKEAARLLRIFWSDESARANLIGRIQKLGEDAANRTEEVLDKEGNKVTVSKPDHKSAITAANSLTAILGMTRQTVDVKVSYEKMSDAQLWAEAAKYIPDTSPKALPAANGEINNVGSISSGDEEIEVGDGEFEELDVDG